MGWISGIDQWEKTLQLLLMWQQRCAHQSVLRGRKIALLGLSGWSLCAALPPGQSSTCSTCSAAKCFSLSWECRGRKLVSHTLNIFFFIKKEKKEINTPSFPLSLSLLKAPRSLKDWISRIYEKNNIIRGSLWKTLFQWALCLFLNNTFESHVLSYNYKKNITWYSTRYVSFDYASRERHGIQREYKGRMMAVYQLINLHLSTVNLSSLCCQSRTSLAVIAEIWNHGFEIHLYIHIFLWPVLVYCFSGCSVSHQHGTWHLRINIFPLLCSLCSYQRFLNHHLFTSNYQGKCKKPSGNSKGNKWLCVTCYNSGL